jgi:hypothetical protein
MQARHFNKDGRLTTADFTTTVGKEARTAVELADGEGVVLERLPLAIEPRSGVAEARAVRYGPTRVAMTLKAPSGARIRLSNGPMTIQPRKRYLLTVGDARRGITAGNDAVLAFDVKSGSATAITIGPE